MIKLIRISILFILLYSYGFRVFCQEKENDVSSDSLLFVKPNKLVNSPTEDSENDTLKKVPSWRKNLVELISRPGSPGDTIRENNIQTNNFHTYSGLTVRNINFIQLQTFGQEVYDTTKKNLNWFQKVGNKSHAKTYEAILRNRLLIDKGDKIEPVILADNERLLRELPYIQDARIIIEFDSLVKDSIDLSIIIKDKWPAAFSYEMFDLNYGKIAAWNKNIFGTGHELSFESVYNLNRAPNLSYMGEYKIHNIYNTQIQSVFVYENKWDKTVYEIKLDKRYLTPETKYAGGLNYYHKDQYRTIYTKDTIYENLFSKNNYYDAWVGRSFSILPFRNYFTRTNLFINGRYTNYAFIDKPELNRGLFYEFYNRKIFLFSLGISEQGYFKTKLVYGFGDTEDIPFGKSINIIYGVENNEFEQRSYTGLEISAGGYYPGIGYLYNEAKIASFYGKELEQGMLTYKFDYFSPLFGTKRFLFRYFTELSFTGGFNRYSDEYFRLEKNTGIRGLSSSSVLARQELYMNNEIVCYSPHHVLGFRFVYFMFVDAGVIDYDNNNLLNNPIYTGFGGGVRIRNNRLVFNTIQFRLAYYPTCPDISDKEYLQLVGVGTPRKNDFSIYSPEVLGFENRYR